MQYARLKTALATVALMFVGALAAPASHADDAHDLRSLLTRYDILALSTRNVSRVAIPSPGTHTREVMAIFKLRLARFWPEPFGIARERFRPFLTGGTADIRIAGGNSIGENLPGQRQTQAFHIGGGAELMVRDQLFLSMDFAEMMHGGPLQDQSYRTYRLGFVYDF